MKEDIGVRVRSKTCNVEIAHGMKQAKNSTCARSHRAYVTWGLSQRHDQVVPRAGPNMTGSIHG